MRIALLYPPPWKIPMPGESVDTHGDGPPTGFRPNDLDPDFFQTPYGLFTLGAQAIRAGHQVKVMNLSAYPWQKVEQIIAELDADLFGMSCWTANRRGVALVANAIKRLHPKSHVVVGGPHATPLGKEILEHYPQIDTICVGESEITLLELIHRLENGQSTTGIAGTVYRTPKGVELGPERHNIKDLDTLSSPHDHFATHILMTSRGCPWACTFCGAETAWGRGYRAHSVDYTLDAIEKVLPKLPVKMIQIKDDTFTTNRKRVLELCEGIQKRNLKFIWSCDTRVDLLTEPLLREMRLAGCERLSLGVETGSQTILDAIDKKITVEEILTSTELAKSVGLQVRYFMMLGNRGETRKTFEETLAFLQRAQPNEYVFSCLSIYPGTRDFYDAEAAGRVEREVYFQRDFQELKMPFDSSDEDTAFMNEWFYSHSGIRRMYQPGSKEYRQVLNKLGDHHAAHMDLGGALLKEGQISEGKTHIEKALDLHYPLPGLAHNHLAYAAYKQGDINAMKHHFEQGMLLDPQHPVLLQNIQRTRRWLQQGGPTNNTPLDLVVDHEFVLLEQTTQPTLPGPLPEGWQGWAPAQPAAPIAADNSSFGQFQKRSDLSTHCVAGDFSNRAESASSTPDQRCRWSHFFWRPLFAKVAIFSGVDKSFRGRELAERRVISLNPNQICAGGCDLPKRELGMT